MDSNEKQHIKNVLENDGVIAFVTDTVWGIGCIPENKKAVEKIYKIKHRDGNKPLILMSYDIYPLLRYVEQPLCKPVHKLIKAHFPGALTVVVKKNMQTPDYITSCFDTVGIRVPDNNVFQEICKCTEYGVLATTSANVSSFPPALNYSEAMEYIGNSVDYVVKDYGEKAKGTASTVVGVSEESINIFRQGDIIINSYI